MINCKFRNELAMCGIDLPNILIKKPIRIHLEGGCKHTKIFWLYYREKMSLKGIDLPCYHCEIKESYGIGKNGMVFKIKHDDLFALFFHFYDGINKIHYLCSKKDLMIKDTFKKLTSITLFRVQHCALIKSDFFHEIEFKLMELNKMM